MVLMDPLAHTLFTGMSNSGQAGTKIEAIKTAGATEGPERARELKLMLCSAFGLPETMFGDAKVGNHATAHTLERTVDLGHRLIRLCGQIFLRVY